MDLGRQLKNLSMNLKIMKIKVKYKETIEDKFRERKSFVTREKVMTKLKNSLNIPFYDKINSHMMRD